MDTGLLIARLVFGMLMTVHGCQKLFGWFGGPGMRGTAMFLEGLGFGPAGCSRWRTLSRSVAVVFSSRSACSSLRLPQ